jgi:hypothetical protein
VPGGATALRAAQEQNLGRPSSVCKNSTYLSLFLVLWVAVVVVAALISRNSAVCSVIVLDVGSPPADFDGAFPPVTIQRDAVKFVVQDDGRAVYGLPILVLARNVCLVIRAIGVA